MNIPTLRTQDLTKNFGRFTAINHISIEIPPSELCAIIGPNGAGKTTLFNLLSGKHRPSEGRIFFKEDDVTGWTIERRVRAGMGRAFQVISLFSRLSVFDNLMVAVIARHKRELRAFNRAHKQREIEEEVWQLLQSIGLDKQAWLPANALSQGDKKRLDLGIALGNKPTLLLLDEPTSGMNPEETVNTIQLIKQIHSNTSMTVLFTEHNMGVVFTIAQRIIVIQQGSVIAEGKPEEVRQNRAVIEAYLGEEVPC